MLDVKKAAPVYYNIETLAKKTGLARRTIHYYVQRGLLPRPEGGGRGHYYTEEHVQRIKSVQRWRSQGVPLEKMKLLLSEEDVDLPSPLDVLPQQTGTRPLRHEATSLALARVEPSSVISETSHWRRLRIGTSVELHFTPGALSQEDL